MIIKTKLESVVWFFWILNSEWGGLVGRQKKLFCDLWLGIFKRVWLQTFTNHTRESAQSQLMYKTLNIFRTFSKRRQIHIQYVWSRSSWTPSIKTGTKRLFLPKFYQWFFILAISSKLLSMILYISFIDSSQYQINSTEISFEFSVWINQGSYVRRSPDFFKKTLGLLKTMRL